MGAPIVEHLPHICQRVADRIGASRYHTWFGRSTQLRLSGNQLDVTVQNAFVGRWIANNYMPALLAAAREVTGAEPRVSIRVAPGGTAPAPAGAPAPVRPAAPPRARRGPGALRGDLDSFVVGPSNRLAYLAASGVVACPEQAPRALVVHGGCGLGKTHLLQGICNGVRRAHPAQEWRYLSGEEFTNEFIYALKANRIDGFRAIFRNVDLLVIDDIHFLANKKATQDELLHTFNAIDACGKLVVLSSDRHPRTIADLSEPLISRLIAGMVVQIDPPDYATRREILRRRAAAMRQPVPDEVLELVARQVTRNVRELEGALYKLVALASLTRDRLTPELARRALADYLTQRRPPGAAGIERTVAAYFEVTREQIHSRSRDRTVALARAVTMHLIRKHTRMSFPEIGRLLGNKNHSTVLMATQRIQRLLEHDGTVAWKSPSGRHAGPLRGVLGQLEEQLGRRCE